MVAAQPAEEVLEPAVSLVGAPEHVAPSAAPAAPYDPDAPSDADAPPEYYPSDSGPGDPGPDEPRDE